ncbi:MAG: hypothetical protein KBT39_07845 [Bacteroidales bacterium]|nr:hypothetical protein [Bacteroidales bacterium]
MADLLLHQLQHIRQLFYEAAPEDAKTINDYGWTVVKALLQHTAEVDGITCRQLLADCIKLPIERPSKLHSALLSAAVKVSSVHPQFRFAAYLKLWGIENLRPEDHERQHATSPQSSSSACGEHVEPSSLTKSFPSLAEKTTKALAHSLLLHPEDELTADLVPLLQSAGYQVRSSSSSSSLIHSLLVTRIKQATGKDGRKLIFVTLTSPEGLEVECISSQLQPSPLHPLPEGKRHYVNIGQLYDCLLHTKQESSSSSSLSSSLSSPLSLKEAYLSQQKSQDVFPQELGYIESIDQQHAHMHIYDGHSRHFVAPVQRFSKERAGDFVRFIPIIPQASKFKTAIILTTVPSDSSEVQTLLRDIRITHINKEKGYAAWELTDKSHPITELLSPLQLSQGETSPTFTTGYLNLTEELSSSLSLSSYKAFIYLKRGKDKIKRPHIARIM